MPTTFFLTDTDPEEFRRTPPLRPSPTMLSSPTFSLKNSFSSLLDSDSESIISSYSPPLNPQVTYIDDHTRTSFDNFLNQCAGVPPLPPTASSLSEQPDIFQGISEPKFSGKRKSTTDANTARTKENRTAASNRVPSPSLSNSTAFSAALGHKSKNDVPPLSSRKKNSPFPKLIMPRISVPSRRPFTPEGLTLGKLKILVTGDSGSGKSQLIKALAQTCKDIVHVDDVPNPIQPLSSHSTPQSSLTDSSLYGNLDLDPNHQHALSELLASTKPRPQFWGENSGSSGSTQFSRRQSVVKSSLSTSSDDITLDRNVCFVDTIGYGSFSSATNCFTPVTSYLESAFEKTLSLINPASKEALPIITSSSSLSECSLADVCIYTIFNRIKPIDVEYMKKLSQYVPIIPAIVKSDLLPLKDILDLKISILKELKSHNITPFLFGATLEEAILHCQLRLDEISGSSGEGSQESTETLGPGENDLASSLSSLGSETPALDVNLTLFPCAISSALAPDAEMVASVLMSSNYVPALHHSELQDLSDHLFSSHGAAWLRYSAGKKFLAWCGDKQATFTLHSQINTSISNAMVTRKNCDLVLKDNSCHQMTHSPIQGLNENAEEFIITLPADHVFETRRRAQRDTSKWVMKLSESALIETSSSISISEGRPVISLRTASRSIPNIQKSHISRRGRPRSRSQYLNGHQTHSRTNSTRLGRDHTSLPLSMSPPRGPLIFKHSLSIINLDPLDLWGKSMMIVNYTVKAVSFIIGAKLVVFLYYHFQFTSPSPEVVSVSSSLQHHSSLISQVGSSAISTFLALVDAVSNEFKNPESFLNMVWRKSAGSASNYENIISSILTSLGGGWSNLV